MKYPKPYREMPELDRAVWRLYSRTDVREWYECWEYEGTQSCTYPSLGTVSLFGERRDNIGGHRLSWMIAHRKWPDKGMVVMHKCDNPRCVNPNHLELGTYKQNNGDRPRTGRWVGGGMGKLSLEQVAEIRASSDSQVVLARRYGVGQSAISNIKSGKTYMDKDPMKKRLRGCSKESIKLDENKVREIRRMWDNGATGPQIAKKFDLSQAQAHKVATRKSWKHVPEDSPV